MLITQAKLHICPYCLSPFSTDLEPGPGKSPGQGCQDREGAGNSCKETQLTSRLGGEKAGEQGDSRPRCQRQQTPLGTVTKVVAEVSTHHVTCRSPQG